MEQPWGISGPEFLWIYGAGLVAALAWALVVRAAARRPRLTEPPPVLDLEALAFLAGGARRVVEVAIARVIENGAVRVNRKGTLTAVQTSVAHTDPLDAAVMRALGNRTRRVDPLIRAVRAPDRIEGLADMLAARQLVLTPREAARARRLSMLGPFLLLAIGAVRLVNGAVKGLPVSFLAIQLVVTGMVIVVLTKRRIQPRTVHGDRVLEQARSTVTDGVGPVALNGLGSFPDLDVRWALAKSTSTRSSTAWSYGAGVYAACSATSSSCGGSGGGSSGGSGCGGGGGGCGGGGGG